ncbi:TonB-dependent receptor [soil metagenome]
MTNFSSALVCAPLLLAVPAHAEDDQRRDVIVLAPAQATTIENAPSTTASITAAQIADTVNASNVEDTIKYLPGLVVRKRHIGDTQSPLATRTSGVGASARSLIYADGALLSSLIGNNNTIASPRWGLVTPQEIDRIDVLYGPFSAAYPGNSIGAVVNIVTRLPERLEATATAGVNLQTFRQYGTDRILPAGSFGATIGDRFGPLALFASASRVVSNSQPLSYITALRGAAGATGTPAVGGYDDVNRNGAAIRVIGAGGFEHQMQHVFKVKAALDIKPGVRLTYVGGLFLNDTDSTAESYLTGAAGPVYAGSLNIAGYPYTIAASAFSNNVYRYDQRHWSHSLSAEGKAARFDWQVIGTLYDFARDEQRVPTVALPAASSAGSGNVTRLEGTGWATFDAKGLWRVANHAVGFGYHRDRFKLISNRYATVDWIGGAQGALNLASRGSTRTDAAWLQDAWQLAPPLTLTLGGRYEWWKAYDGFNFAASPALSVAQPGLSAHRFSPKASLTWEPSARWKASLSFGEAYRFPTVTELYQTVTTGNVLTVPNPNLRPERAVSGELALRRGSDDRFVRLSLFTESITDALLSQSAILVPGSTALFSYVQNVDRVRTRGAELAVQQADVLRGFDLSGSITLVDPRIRADAAFPTAIGKRPPQVPTTKATIVATWRPDAAVSLTAAARYASRSFGTIDNSDPVSNTYQGFGSYLVVDARAVIRVTPKWSMALGVDNIANARYFLFHPFPQRSLSAELGWRF